MQSDRAPAQLLDLGHRVLRFGSRSAIVYDDVSTFFGKVQSDEAAETFRGAGDENDAAIERILVGAGH
jgi:hypothetical protein